MYKKTSGKNILLFILFAFVIAFSPQNRINANDQKNHQTKNNLIISKIIISGNKHVKTDVILNRLPYKVGTKFDKTKSKIAINNLYTLGYFRQINLEIEKENEDLIILYVTVEEKKLLEKLEFKGNKHIKTKKIIDDLHLDKLSTVDEENLKRICQIIKKMYSKENFHKTEITTQIIPNKQVRDKAIVIFNIKEGPKSFLARVNFKGNKKILDRKLRTVIFTREDWLLSFLDGAGQYEQDAIEMDKHRIEYFYKDNGYLMAIVPKVDVEFLKNDKEIYVTFHIKEGDQFFVQKINAVGDELFNQEKLLEQITVEKNKPYSQSKLIESINNLKNLYGEKGYIFADVYPQIKPDEKTNDVDITFHVEKGNLLHVKRITITGNKLTHDKVIRRQIELDENEKITSRKLNNSQSNIEYLGFFQKGGINWKIHRVSDELADLEMNVKEAKTGNFQAGITYGSDKYSLQPSLRGNITVEKKNLFGMGWDTGLMLQGNRHHIQKLQAHFFEPHILDSDVSGYATFYRRWEDYEQWRNVDKTPKETVTGGSLRFGFRLPRIDRRLQLLLEIGIENIKNNNPQPVRGIEFFEPIVKRSFQSGTLTWLGLDLVKDTRNHQIYPNKGHKILLNTKTALPALNDEFSFFKAELDTSYYTPLIGEDNLVLALHGKIGTIHSIGGADKANNRTKIIPYKELYHMGGQGTVRGFVWGSIGPAWITNDPLGARYAVQLNCELIFPLIPDYSMKGHFFYDAGAGWNTPKEGITNRSMIKRDKFNMRHSVGFGLNLLKPVPAKIDWGYKLDRDKKAGESPHEFHLSMNYAW